MCAPNVQQCNRPDGVAGPEIGSGVPPAGTDALMSNRAASLGQGLQGRVSPRPGREKHENDRPEVGQGVSKDDSRRPAPCPRRRALGVGGRALALPGTRPLTPGVRISRSREPGQAF